MKRTVLIIDDDQITVEVARDMLRSYYELWFAIESKTGLEIALRQKPDLILLDIQMPKLNGFEFIERYRELSDVETAFIIMSSQGAPGLKQRAAALGVHHFVEKPLDAVTLPLALEAIFEGLDLQKQQASE